MKGFTYIKYESAFPVSISRSRKRGAVLPDIDTQFSRWFPNKDTAPTVLIIDENQKRDWEKMPKAYDYQLVILDEVYGIAP